MIVIHHHYPPSSPFNVYLIRETAVALAMVAALGETGHMRGSAMDEYGYDEPNMY